VRLLIIRHAIAVPRGAPGIPDAERPLTPRGERRFADAARGLARIAGRPDALLTSPWLRARRTAEIAAEAWGGPDPAVVPALAGGSFEEVCAALARRRKQEMVALVGHEPYLSAFAARLLGSRAPESFVFRKGGAALVELPGAPEEGGRLVWWLPSRLLRRLRG
jgi:phosphohistidine phosphatase